MANWMRWAAILALAAPAVALGQERLSLDEAVARARARHASVQSAALQEREAAFRTRQARAGYLPRADVVESWQRGNMPVYVFSSLLAQRRFSQSDFDVARLNHPDDLDNFRAAVAVEQPLFDPATGAAVRAAALGEESAALARRDREQALALAAVEAYGRVLLLEALADAARAAVAAAAEDARRARDRHEAGTVTEADVLSIEVHAAAMRAKEIETAAEAQVARAHLNEIVGAPLDTVFVLDAAPAPDCALPALTTLEAAALAARPDVLRAGLERRLADAAVSQARAGFLPHVAFRSLWEWNGASFGSREPGWLIGTEVRVNVFRGGADKAGVERARVAVARANVERTRVEDEARLEVRAAVARAGAARARRDVAQTLLARARESQRITRDRYEQGLSDATALLQSAQAVLDAAAQETAARVDVLVTRAALKRALGR